MHWSRFVVAIFVGGIAMSFTDWLFMGVLCHRDYMRYPEIWRRKPGDKGETAAVIYSVATGFLTCAVFVFVCNRLNLVTYSRALKLVLAVWAMAPLPLLVTNALFVKIHPRITSAHALGWLARLVVCALAVVWILR